MEFGQLKKKSTAHLALERLRDFNKVEKERETLCLCLFSDKIEGAHPCNLKRDPAPGPKECWDGSTGGEQTQVRLALQGVRSMVEEFTITIYRYIRSSWLIVVISFL